MSLILVVDDEERNRELVQAYLRRGRHRVLCAASGHEALRLAGDEHPDVAVVDLDMPDLDGLQTMRQLKRQTAGEYLPVILLVPFADLATRLGAWQAGADEVLTKPVHRDELIVRIDNLLALRAERLEMARTNSELLRLQEFKTNLDQLLVHDLKNPLAALSANLEYTAQEVPSDSRIDLIEAIQDALSASRRLQRMVASILDVAAFEEGALAPKLVKVPVAPLLAELQRLHRHAAEERGVVLEVECAADLDVEADRELLTRVVENLLEAALRRTARAGRLSIRASRGPEHVRIEVTGTALPIPAEVRAHLFEKYGVLESGDGQTRVGVGLGLYFCRLAVEAHGGRIFLGDGERVSFVLELPASGKR